MTLDTWYVWQPREFCLANFPWWEKLIRGLSAWVLKSVLELAPKPHFTWAAIHQMNECCGDAKAEMLLRNRGLLSASDFGSRTFCDLRMVLRDTLSQPSSLVLLAFSYLFPYFQWYGCFLSSFSFLNLLATAHLPCEMFTWNHMG